MEHNNLVFFFFLKWYISIQIPAQSAKIAPGRKREQQRCKSYRCHRSRAWSRDRSPCRCRRSWEISAGPCWRKGAEGCRLGTLGGGKDTKQSNLNLFLFLYYSMPPAASSHVKYLFGFCWMSRRRWQQRLRLPTWRKTRTVELKWRCSEERSIIQTWWDVQKLTCSY